MSTKQRNSPKKKPVDNKGLHLTNLKIFNAKNSQSWVFVDSSKKGTALRKLKTAKKLWDENPSVIYVPEYRVAGTKKDVEAALEAYGKSLKGLETITLDNHEKSNVYLDEMEDLTSSRREHRIIDDMLYLAGKPEKELTFIETPTPATENKKVGVSLANKFKSMKDDQYLDVSNFSKGKVRYTRTVPSGKFEVNRIVSDNEEDFGLAVVEIYGKKDNALIDKFAKLKSASTQSKKGPATKTDKEIRNVPKPKTKK